MYIQKLRRLMDNWAPLETRFPMLNSPLVATDKYFTTSGIHTRTTLPSKRHHLTVEIDSAEEMFVFDDKSESLTLRTWRIDISPIQIYATS